MKDEPAAEPGSGNHQAQRWQRQLRGGRGQNLSSALFLSFQSLDGFGVMTINGCNKGGKQLLALWKLHKHLQRLARVPPPWVCKARPFQPTKYRSESPSPLRSTLEELQPSFYHFLIPNTKLLSALTGGFLCRIVATF